MGLFCGLLCQQVTGAFKYF